MADAYRLCPKSGPGAVTESCFQSHHLTLNGNTSYIQWGANPYARTPIPALRTTSGTFPPKSQWTRNPIPACAGYLGGVGGGFNCKASKGATQFPPPLPGLFGYGKTECYDGRGAHCTQEEQTKLAYKFNFNIVDKLTVPKSLPAGDYWLGYRYDAEQTPQVWAQCADVTLV